MSQTRKDMGEPWCPLCLLKAVAKWSELDQDLVYVLTPTLMVTGSKSTCKNCHLPITRENMSIGSPRHLSFPLQVNLHMAKSDKLAVWLHTHPRKGWRIAHQSEDACVHLPPLCMFQVPLPTCKLARHHHFSLLHRQSLQGSEKGLLSQNRAWLQQTWVVGRLLMQKLRLQCSHRL